MFGEGSLEGRGWKRLKESSENGTDLILTADTSDVQLRELGEWN